MMPSAEAPRFDAGATRIDIARGSAKGLIVILPLVATVCACCVFAALDAPDTPTMIVGVCFAGFFGLILIAALLALPRLVEPRGLVFDPRGVHFWRRSDWDLVPWEEIAAVGIGYERPRRPPVVRLSQHLADQALDALKLERRRYVAVEIFPRVPAALDRHPGLGRYRRDQPPPREGLSAVRWRVPLHALRTPGDTLEQAVRALHPGRWLGWFER